MSSANRVPPRRSSRLLAKRLKIDADTYSTPPSVQVPILSLPFENLAIEIFRVLIKSNYLNTEDLGKLLLFTSNKFARHLFHSRDEIWETLLINRFGHSICALTKTQKVPKEGIGSDCGCVAEWLFRSLLRNPVFPKKESIRPLKYSPEDYYLIVNIFRAGGSKAIFTKVMHGPQIPSFFKNGKVTIETTEDLCIGDYDILGNWKVTVHIMRTVDQNCCCLFQSDDAFVDLDYIHYYSENVCLEVTDAAYGQQLFDIIDNSNDSVCDGICFGVNFICRMPGCCCGFCVQVPSHGEVTAIEVEASLAFPYDLFVYPEKSSISFAHVLEILDIWENYY